MKKIFAIVLSLLMLTSLLTVQISANDGVCYIGSADNIYNSLEDAIKAGGDIYLLTDAVLSTDAHFYGKTVRLYGNGKTVTVSDLISRESRVVDGWL